MFKLKDKSINTDFDMLQLKVYKDITNAEENEFLASYNLPKDVFYFDNIKPINPPSDVEERLETHVFIIGEKEAFWFIKDSYSN